MPEGWPSREWRGCRSAAAGAATVCRIDLVRLHLWFGGAQHRGRGQCVDPPVVSDTLGYGALTEVETVIGRKVSPTLYSRADWRKRLQDDDPFVALLMTQPRIHLIGNEYDFAESA